MRELSLRALMLMEGQEVIVHDLAYDAYDQICTVKVERGKPIKLKNGKYQDGPITKLWLENEEYIFTYNGIKCGNGEFQVFTLK